MSTLKACGETNRWAKFRSPGQSEDHSLRPLAKSSSLQTMQLFSVSDVSSVLFFLAPPSACPCDFAFIKEHHVHAWVSSDLKPGFWSVFLCAGPCTHSLFVRCRRIAACHVSCSRLKLRALSWALVIRTAPEEIVSLACSHGLPSGSALNSAQSHASKHSLVPDISSLTTYECERGRMRTTSS